MATAFAHDPTLPVPPLARAAGKLALAASAGAAAIAAELEETAPATTEQERSDDLDARFQELIAKIGGMPDADERFRGILRAWRRAGIVPSDDPGNSALPAAWKEWKSASEAIEASGPDAPEEMDEPFWKARRAAEATMSNEVATTLAGAIVKLRYALGCQVLDREDQAALYGGDDLTLFARADRMVPEARLLVDAIGALTQLTRDQALASTPEWEAALSALRLAEAESDNHWQGVECPISDERERLFGKGVRALEHPGYKVWAAEHDLQAVADESNRLMQAAMKAENRLFETPAPDLDAALLKLERLWADERDPIPGFQRLVLADLRRITSASVSPLLHATLLARSGDGDLASAIAEAKRLEVEAIAYCKGVADPARQALKQALGAVDASIPHRVTSSSYESMDGKRTFMSTERPSSIEVGRKFLKDRGSDEGDEFVVTCREGIALLDERNGLVAEAKARITIEHGVDHIEAEEERRYEAVRSANDRIVATPCGSLNELLAKFDRLTEVERLDLDEEDVVAALRADIERLATGSVDPSPIAPIEQMQAWLNAIAGDPAGYAKLWLRLAASAELSVSVEIGEGGDQGIWWGGRDDGWSPERRSIGEMMIKHLTASGNRQAVIDALKAEYRFADRRPNEPRATSRVLRELLATGNRILIEPDGQLDLSPAIPAGWGERGDEHDDRMIAAVRAWRGIMRRHRSFDHIKRAVRMLGRRLPNGWQVLERQAVAA